MNGSSRSSRGDENIFSGIVQRSQSRKSAVKLGWGLIVLLVVVGLFVLFGMSMQDHDAAGRTQQVRQGPDPDELMTTPWADTGKDE